MAVGRQIEPVLPQHVDGPQNIEGRENEVTLAVVVTQKKRGELQNASKRMKSY